MKNIATKNLTSLLMVLAIAAPTAAYGQQTTRPVTGTSGGSQTSADCGFIPDKPDYSFSIGPSATSVSIEVSGSGDHTLLMLGPDNSRECILAHDFDGGIIQSRGLYKPGNYELYVGDIDGAGADFSLNLR
ncbi:MAG: hypothetical protein AAF821_13730 [Cyanobacteria bacterium P01_D01_bin.156]